MDANRLRRLDLFADLKPGDVDAIASYAREKRVRSGAVIRHWDLGENLVALEAGETHVERWGRILAKLGAGDLLGHFAPFWRPPGEASVVAGTPLVLIAVSGWDLKRLERASPGLRRRLEGAGIGGATHATGRWRTPELEDPFPRRRSGTSPPTSRARPGRRSSGAG